MVCYQKYRADRHSVQSRKRLEGHHILTDLDNLLVEKVSCLIRDKLIEKRNACTPNKGEKFSPFLNTGMMIHVIMP